MQSISGLSLPAARVASASGALRGMVPLSDGPTIMDKVESVGICGGVMAAPSMMGAAFGWGGMVVGLVGTGIAVAAATKQGEREILLPLSLMVGAVAGFAGACSGWPGAVIATGLGAAYGYACA
ncbi:MAG: hypothetical protein FJX76_15670 [Armatimonadetes bacterium]|nr:hypothetical protein [Armatimonadota bacterium]